MACVAVATLIAAAAAVVVVVALVAVVSAPPVFAHDATAIVAFHADTVLSVPDRPVQRVTRAGGRAPGASGAGSVPAPLHVHMCVW